MTLNKESAIVVAVQKPTEFRSFEFGIHLEFDAWNLGFERGGGFSAVIALF